MKDTTCTCCGSSNLIETYDDFIIHEPFAGHSTVRVHVLECLECGFAEDDEANDLIINNELAVLKRKSMVNVLNDMNKEGYTNASMERILGLPARTLARWKNDMSVSPSAAGIALMRIVRTFPWLLNVAEYKFDQEKARSIFLSVALNELHKIDSETKHWQVESGIYTSEELFVVAKAYSRETIPVVTKNCEYQVVENLEV
jgi:transcriptional regulator with XRE-family HTH domain